MFQAGDAVPSLERDWIFKNLGACKSRPVSIKISYLCYILVNQIQTPLIALIVINSRSNTVKILNNIIDTH